MPFFTLAGVTYQVQADAATQGQSDPIGAVRRTRNGSARRGTRGQARNWSKTLAPIVEADFQTLQAATYARKFVTLDGDFLGGPLLCWVEITNAKYYRPKLSVGLHRIVTLDIHECNPVVTAATITPVEFLLTSVADPGGATNTYVSTPDGSYPGDSSQSFYILPGATMADLDPGGFGTYPVVLSLAPEKSWLSVPLDVGFISGRPYVRVEVAEAPGAYTGTSVWRIMDVMSKIFLVRGGVDIGGPWFTNYTGVSIGGGVGTMTSTTSVAIPLVAGDRLRVEMWGRLALTVGATDNAQRQLVNYGTVPGPRSLPILGVYGTVSSL